MSRPQLYVFAGPNGAGKSTLSAAMVQADTVVFDGDIVFKQLKEKFYDLDESLLWEHVNEGRFGQWKINALSTGVDAAFETNFRSAEVIATVKSFMAAGFESRLIFMGLDSVEASIERVKLRVMSGGHDVSLEFITKNYHQSLDNLYAYYSEFTSVHIFQNFQAPEGHYEMLPLMLIEGGLVREAEVVLPEWAAKLLDIISR